MYFIMCVVSINVFIVIHCHCQIVQSNPKAVSVVEGDCFQVSSSKQDGTVYEVNSKYGICSCFSGQQGGFCKHQAAVHITSGKIFPNCPLLTPEDKMSLYTVATGGESEMSASFFAPIDSLAAPFDRETETLSSSLNVGTAEEGAANSRSRCTASTEDTRTSAAGVDSSQLESEVFRLSQMLQENSSDQGLVKAAEKFAIRLRKISSPMQLYQFFTAAEQRNTRGGRLIRVQPTSVARRAEGSTHGSARHRAGRPLACPNRRGIKRDRSLSANVAASRPNAKSHGDGH